MVTTCQWLKCRYSSLDTKGERLRVIHESNHQTREYLQIAGLILKPTGNRSLVTLGHVALKWERNWQQWSRVHSRVSARETQWRRSATWLTTWPIAQCWHGSTVTCLERKLEVGWMWVGWGWVGWEDISLVASEVTVLSRSCAGMDPIHTHTEIIVHPASGFTATNDVVWTRWMGTFRDRLFVHKTFEAAAMRTISGGWGWLWDGERETAGCAGCSAGGCTDRHRKQED